MPTLEDIYAGFGNDQHDTSRVEKVNYNELADINLTDPNDTRTMDEKLQDSNYPGLNKNAYGQIIKDHKYQSQIAALQMKQLQQVADLNTTLGRARAELTSKMSGRKSVDAFGNPTYTTLENDLQTTGKEIADYYSQSLTDPLVKEHFKSQFDLEIKERQLQSSGEVRSQQLTYLKSSFDVSEAGILAKVFETPNTNLQTLIDQYSNSLGVAVSQNVFTPEEAAQKTQKLTDEISTAALRRDIKTYGAEATKKSLLEQPDKYLIPKQDIENIFAQEAELTKGLQAKSVSQTLQQIERGFLSQETQSALQVEDYLQQMKVASPKAYAKVEPLVAQYKAVSEALNTGTDYEGNPLTEQQIAKLQKEQEKLYTKIGGAVTQATKEASKNEIAQARAAAKSARSLASSAKGHSNIASKAANAAQDGSVTTQGVKQDSSTSTQGVKQDSSTSTQGVKQDSSTSTQSVKQDDVATDQNTQKAKQDGSVTTKGVKQDSSTSTQSVKQDDVATDQDTQEVWAGHKGTGKFLPGADGELAGADQLTTEDQIALDTLKDENPKVFRQLKPLLKQRQDTIEKIRAADESFQMQGEPTESLPDDVKAENMDKLLASKEALDNKIGELLHKEDLYIDEAGYPVEFLSQKEAEKKYPVRKRSKNAYDLVAAAEEDEYVAQDLADKESQRQFQLERTRMVADLEAEIKDGAPGTRELLEVMKELITPEEYFKYYDMIDAKEIEMGQRATQMSTLFEKIRLGEDLSKEKPEDLQAAYDYAVEDTANKLGRDLAPQEKAQLAVKIGVPVEKLNSDLNQLIQNGTPEQAVQAANAYAYMRDNNVNMLKGIPEKTSEMAEQILEQTLAGVPYATAIQNIKQEQAAKTPEQKQLVKEYNKLDINTSGSFERGNYVVGYLKQYAGIEASDMDPQIVNQFMELYRSQWFKDGGQNPDKAASYAAKKIAEQYGTTNLNGGKYLMQFPPEAVVPGFADDPGYMTRQLRDDILQAVPDIADRFGGTFNVTENVKIVAAPQTAQALKEGKGPAYLIELYDVKDGVPQYRGVLTAPNGDFQYWHPQGKSKEELRAETQAKLAKVRINRPVEPVEQAITQAVK